MFAVFQTCYCISRTSNGISKKEMLLQQMSACADNSGSLALLRLKNTRGGELILIDLLKITLLHIYIYIYIYHYYHYYCYGYYFFIHAVNIIIQIII